MRAALLGCGSIGKRHLAALLDFDAVDEVVVRTHNTGCLEGLANAGKARVVDALPDEAFDLGVVATETAQHYTDAALLLDRGANVLVEKPVCRTMEEAEALAGLASDRDAHVFVGYNMRFLPALRTFADRLGERAIGEPLLARLEVGQYLPDWRPGTDWRASYSASAERGGGVALDLSHEIDLMRFLFGDPGEWKTARSNTGTLGIDAEEVFDGIYTWDDGFSCSVHMDYLARRKRRVLRVLGSEGEAECDLVAGIARIASAEGEEVIDDPAAFDMAGTLRTQLEVFAGSSAELGIAGLGDGIWALRLLEDSDA